MSDWREEARARRAGKMWKDGDDRKQAGRGVAKSGRFRRLQIQVNARTRITRAVLPTDNDTSGSQTPGLTSRRGDGVPELKEHSRGA